MGKHHWFLFSDDKLRFYTKKCVPERSWEKINDNIMRTNYHSKTNKTSCTANNVMTISAYIRDRNIFFEMTILADWQHAVRDNQYKQGTEIFPIAHCFIVNTLGKLLKAFSDINWQCFASQVLRVDHCIWNSCPQNLDVSCNCNFQ